MWERKCIFVLYKNKILKILDMQSFHLKINKDKVRDRVCVILSHRRDIKICVDFRQRKKYLLNVLTERF